MLTDLRRRLANGPAPRIAVLCGLGGVGKTSVAVEYAYRQAASLNVVWVFAAEDPLTLTTGFTDLATALGVGELPAGRDPAAAVHGALATRTGGWLLVFDNVTRANSVRGLIPPTGGGQVLITTQNPHWPANQLVSVPVLDNDTSANFLTARMADATQRETVESLAAELGGLPLALEQAAAFMTASGLSMTRYLDLFTSRRGELLARGRVAGYDKQVTTTWSLAFDQLKETPTAVGLLRLLACCAPESIPYDLLLKSKPNQALAPEVAPLLMPLFDDPLAVADAIAALRSYSLIGPPTNGTVSVHRLVQAVTLADLPPNETDAWRDTTATLLEAAVPPDPALPSTWPTYAALVQHAQTALDRTLPAIVRVASYLGNAGSYATARDLCQLITEVRLAELGPDHPKTLNARHGLARWTGDAADPAAARDQLTDLLPTYERTLGPDHPDILVTRHDIARWTGHAGNPAAARDQLTDLLPTRGRTLGPDHPDILATRHDIARWTGHAGKPAAARDQLTDLLPTYERTLGPHHPHTLTSRYNLAHWTGEAGDPAAARDQFAALLPTRERTLGPHHPHTLSTRHSLARWTGDAGDPAAARDQLTSLLPISERTLGPGHPETQAIRRELNRWTAIAAEAGES